jgi:putative flippase GtrA
MNARADEMQGAHQWWLWQWPASVLRTGRFRRFVLVGASGVGVNSLLLFLLHGLAGVPLLAAAALAVELTIIYNYLCHEMWTFPLRRPSVRRFTKFNLTALGALLVNVALVWLLTGAGLFYLLANLIGIAAALTVNLTVSTTWIWGERGYGADRHWIPDHGLAGAHRSGDIHALHDALRLGPDGSGGEDAGAAGRAVPVHDRDPARPARGGRHRRHHRPGRAQQLPRRTAPGRRGLLRRRHRDHR